jgi:hypothetical protein
VDRYGGAVKLGVEGCREICVRGGGGTIRQGQSTGKTERANDVGGEGRVATRGGGLAATRRSLVAS